MSKLDDLANLASNDLERAQKLFECGFESRAKSRDEQLDYLVFSKEYGLGISEDTSEQRQAREDISLDVSGFKRTIDNTAEALKNAAANFKGGSGDFSFKSGALNDLSAEELKVFWEDALLDPFLLKICPQTLPRRILECLLPSDCRDIIKYIGLWRTRDYIETFSLLDSFSPSLTGLAAALDRWDELVEAKYNFKAVELQGGGLKSGTFDGKTIFESDSKAMNVSVSLLARTNKEHFESNRNKEKVIFSQDGTFSIRKSKLDNIKFKIYSKTGQETEYSTTGSKINIFDDLWHQVGFSWNGQSGVLTAYIDGVAIPTKVVSGTAFKGPLAVKSDSEIIVASEKSNSMHKTFFGQLDEICIFPKVLSSQDWQNISTIKSNENLNTMGLSQHAKAWWRMGDNTGDTLVKDGPGGQITDGISQINLTKIPEFEDKSRVIVSRLFDEEDEDAFIDILSQETDLLRLCDSIYEVILRTMDTGFDMDEIKLGFERQFQIPTFNRDPHGEVKVVVEKVVIENLIKIFSKMLLDTLEKYLLDCQNWKELLKAATKSGFALDTSPLARYAQSGTPLGNLIEGFNNPDFWRGFAQDLSPHFSDAHRALSNSVQVGVATGTAGDRQEEWTTFGIGNVSYQEEARIGSTVSDWSGLGIDSQIAIDNQSSSPDSDIIIEIITSASQRLTPAELLELFSSRAEQSSIDKVSDIINKNYPDNEFTDADIMKMFGNFGDALGVQNSINMLIEASQQINQGSELPDDFCLPGQNFSDRIGLRPDRNKRDSDKAAVRDILDSAEQLNPNSSSPCPQPIPLSDYEATALRGAINDVYSSVTMAYDNDLLLYRLGMTSVTDVKEKIQKVLWKGDKITRQVFDQDSGFSDIEIEIKKTQINPEFEAILEQGVIPLKKDGTPDGTRFGGVVKINWNILDLFTVGGSDVEGGFLSEIRPPKSLSPKVEGDEVIDPDVEIKDIGSSLGPYTDYENPKATVSRPTAKLGGEMANSLSGDVLNFTMKDDQKPTHYFSEREGESERGYNGIVSKSKTSLLGTTAAAQSSAIKNSMSRITHTVPFGKSLQGTKYVSFLKEGADPFFFDNVPLEFNLSSELQEEIKNLGYDDSESECDPNEIGSDVSSVTNDSERYTPQENVFSLVSRKNSGPLVLTEDSLKKEAYDMLYREILTALLYKVGDSPLLKPVPGTKDTTSDPLIGLNFLNLNTTPRLIDMQSFSEQVTDDFNQLISCPDDLTQPPLYEALKTSVSRILARVGVADMILRGVIPFSQLFFSKKDPVIKSFIIERLESDIDLFADDAEATKAKIVQQYNKLSKTGATENPSLEEEDFLQNWKVAMDFFIEEEFDFVANRIKEIVHGKCIQEQDSTADGINEEMYMAILKYAENHSDNLNFKTVAVYNNGDVKERFSLKNDHQAIEKIVTKLSFSFADQEIVLSKIEKTTEELLSELGLDFESLECSQGSIYPNNGQTTSAEGHYHEYQLDENGNGYTTSVVGEGSDHQHAIYDYAVVPLLGESDETLHIHSLVPRQQQSTIEDFEIASSVDKYMKKQITQTSDFKILFDFCFNLNDAASLVLVYCLVAADNQIMSRAFSGTKKAVIQMFDWLWFEGPGANPCATKNGVSGLDSSNMFPDMGDAFLDPQYLLMMLLAPLLTFKGWTKVSDPHVFITQTIMDVLNLPINPRMVKKNVPDPFDGGKIKCMDIPTWPGTRPIDDLAMWNPPGTFALSFAAEPTVAAGVTFAPLLVGSPPFPPPTPFAWIYYGLVSPLIWLLKDLPRLQAMLENDPDAQRLLASTGMNVGPITCDDDVATDTGAGSSVEEGDCPPIRTFQDTIIDSASSKCD